MKPLVLRADVNGNVVGWMEWEDAVVLYATDKVIYTLGDPSLRVLGGISRATGNRTEMALHPVIFTHGFARDRLRGRRAPLTRRALFRRDANLCLYCGKQFHELDLTIDHVTPSSRGGRHTWQNVASSCRRCNAHKGDRTPEQARMALITVPYEPCYEEYLLLTIGQRRILADQMTFLLERCPKRDRLWM
jgi:5-methylcytosine-specific restriction endonuclease McrA